MGADLFYVSLILNVLLGKLAKGGDGANDFDLPQLKLALSVLKYGPGLCLGYRPSGANRPLYPPAVMPTSKGFVCRLYSRDNA